MIDRITMNGETFARVCAWCPDKSIRDAEAKAAGLRITHTICPDCAKAMGFPIPEIPPVDRSRTFWSTRRSMDTRSPFPSTP